MAKHPVQSESAEALERHFLDALFQAETAMVVSLSREGRILNINPAGLMLAEVDENQNVIGHLFSDFVLPSERERFKRMHDRIMNGANETFSCQMVGLNGAVHCIEAHSSPVVDHQNNIIAHLSIAHDITQLKATKEQLRKLSNAIENSPNAVFITDTQGVIEYVNPMYSEITGYLTSDVVGNSLRLLNSGETPEEVYETMWRTVYGGQVWRGEVRNRRKNGEVYWAQESVSPITDDFGVITHFVSVHQDITAARKRSDQIDYHASHDNLTGLVNRREFENRLSRVVSTLDSRPSEHVMCVLDLDRFKAVNDVCGHAAGDELLRQISRVLQESVRARDTVARLGGDEFVVLMEHCTVKRGRRIAEKIITSLNRFRFLWEDKSFSIGVSIGLLPITNSAPVDRLLNHADSACYAAKNAGRNRVCVYQEKHQQEFQNSGDAVWVGRVQKALKKDLFELHAQPIVPIGSHSQPRFYEVLVRMRSSKGKTILPGAFFPVSERYSLIDKIDRWVISATLVWMAQQPRSIPMCSINLSGASISDPAFEQFIKNELKKYDSLKLAEKICFEISETLVIANLSDAIRFINRLKKSGCRFCLDDFGSGLSSFSYLKSLPVDYLKIGGSFVKGIEDDPVQEAIVQSVNHIGRMMHRQTIAECIESRETLERVKEIGVDFAQGYSIGKPRLMHRVTQKRMHRYSDNVSDLI
ncbi:MAG: EAL domain-containing protein [Gammaproteobacteria bacterium]|nr:EAL domain-containing protein [Gammaproteobacteria bacterium]